MRVNRQTQGSDGRFQWEEILFDTDEGMRPGTTSESIAHLRPAFKPNGTVTAGNSSQMSDGAAGVLLMSRQKVGELGLRPMATFRCYTTEGCDPEYMGVGPSVAIPKVLELANLTLDQIDLVELNEAFAAQILACHRELKFDMDRTNVNGGAIALGHPIGCTGMRIVVTLLHEMARRQVRYGLATLCVSGGLGIAMLFERV